MLMRQTVIKRSQSVLLIAGVGLLVSSVLMLISMLTGVITTPEYFIAGEATVHSIGRVAISGCLLAALGSFE
jgi:hypothetical protein